MKAIRLTWLVVVSVALASVTCTSKDTILDFGDGGPSANGGTTLSRGTAGQKGSAGAPASASGGSGAGGAAGKIGGSGSGGARACEAAECLRAYECVRTCGGPVEQQGCCPCEAPLFDRVTASCASDAGADAATGGTSGSGGAMMGAGGSKGSGGSKGGSGGSKGGGGASGTGGSSSDGGATCDPATVGLCARPYECIRSCGGPIESNDCCPCQPPLFDNYGNLACKGMGGAGGGVGGAGGAGGSSADDHCQMLRSSYADALTSARKCRLDLNREPCNKLVSSVLGCSCSLYVDDDSQLKPLADAYKQDGCKLVCPAIACVEPIKNICQADTSGAVTGMCAAAP